MHELFLASILLAGAVADPTCANAAFEPGETLPVAGNAVRVQTVREIHTKRNAADHLGYLFETANTLFYQPEVRSSISRAELNNEVEILQVDGWRKTDAAAVLQSSTLGLIPYHHASALTKAGFTAPICATLRNS